MLAHQLGSVQKHPGEITTGTRQAGGPALSYGVAGQRLADDGDGPGGAQRCGNLNRAIGEDRIDLHRRQFANRLFDQLGPALGVAPFDDEVAPFAQAAFAQAGQKCGALRRRQRAGSALAGRAGAIAEAPSVSIK